MSARRRLVEIVCTLLPPEIAASVAGDLEEEWHRRQDCCARAVPWLARELLSLLACAWHSRRLAAMSINAVDSGGRPPMLSTLWREVRDAWRFSLRDPRTTMLSLVTLSLGLGAATALFALTNAWLLRPLPFPEARELAAVWETIPSQDIFENTPAPAVLFEWRARSHAFAGLGALTRGTANLTGAGEPERLNVIRADDELLRVLRLEAAVGRLFATGETAEEVVLSDAFWRRRFAGSRQIIGAAVTLDGAPATVVGVLPAGVTLFGLEADAWRPLRFTAAERASQSRFLWVIGRLGRGVSVEQASADVDAIARSREPGLGARAVSLQAQTVGSLARDLPVLLGATGILLLIACGNVASLTLARATARRREFAVRAALGASRLALARQVVLEALAPGIMGGAAGLLLAGWLVRTFTALLPQRDSPSAVPLTDPRVLVFGAAASIGAAVLVALAPALHSTSRRTLSALREGGRAHSASHTPLKALAAIEIALAVALLISSVVVGRSFLRLSRVDLGFRTDHVVTFELPRLRRDGGGDRTFFDELLRRLADSPAVSAAGLTQALPLKSFGFGSGFPVEGAPAGAPNHPAYWRIISPGYFDALRIPLKAGRTFTRDDRDRAPLVAIVSESYARAAWPKGTTPIGKRIGWATLDQPMTVVGVVADIRLSAAAAAGPTVYMPFEQVDAFIPSHLAVLARASNVEAIDAVRRAVWAIDPLQPVAGIQTLDQLAWQLLARRRFQLALWSGFAGAAALLALLGVYGVMSYVVRRSSKDLGIRLALGARRRSVVAQVLRQSLTMTGIGAAGGVCVAYWTAGLIRGFLIAIEPRDTRVYLSVVMAVLLAAGGAALIPARRAARLEPLDVIRAE